jgi:four helix bundle protein
MAQHFKDLVVWQRAMDMVAEVYELTDCFPKRAVYSLTDQIRRAAVSVPSNIAEGQAHHSHREFRHFLRHSAGSLAELETQLLRDFSRSASDMPIIHLPRICFNEGMKSGES